MPERSSPGGSLFEDETAESSTTTTTAPVAPRRAKRSGGRRVMTVFFTILLALLVGAGLFLGYYLNRVSNAIDSIQRDPKMMPTQQTTPAPAEPSSTAKNKPVTFVLMGSDSRGNADQGRSDSLMIAYVSGDRKNIYLTSFPRDMWVDIPGHKTAKINAAYAWGGPALTVQTLEQLTGVKMQHSALMDFEGFMQLTEVLGGVLIYNEHASKTGRFDFPEGWITIKGEAALMYVRERKNLPGGDLDRAKRQRDVIQAIMAKMLAPETLANPAKFGATVDAFAKCMTVDSGLTKDEINKFARSMRITGADSIKQLQAPITGFGTSADGQSIALVDEAGLAELSAAMKNDTMAQYHAKHKK